MTKTSLEKEDNSSAGGSRGLEFTMVRRRSCKQEKGIRSKKLRDRIPTLNKGSRANYMWGEGISSQINPLIGFLPARRYLLKVS